jgi:ATP-dependent protease ClpP protease subunit
MWRVFNDATDKAKQLMERRRPQNRGGQTWYRIENNTSADSAEIYIYAEIGWYGIEAAQFVAELKALNVGNITLHVNSPGGDVPDAMAIMNALRAHPAKVTAEVDGIAASAASFIVQGADRVVMKLGSRMMIHDAVGMMYGNAADMEEFAGILRGFSEDIASVYAARSGGTTDEWRERMRAETWFSAEEAVAVGLADEVDTTSKRDGNVGNLEGITKHSITVPFSIDLQDIIDSAAQKIRETETIHVDTGLIEAGIQLAANNRPAADPPRPPVDERTTGADISAAILRGVGE